MASYFLGLGAYFLARGEKGAGAAAMLNGGMVAGVSLMTDYHGTGKKPISFKMHGTLDAAQAATAATAPATFGFGYPAPRRQSGASFLRRTFFILISILGYSVVTSRYMNSLESKNPVSIQVVGHQWWWEVQYPNSDASQWVITANEIHVPVGVPVVLQTSSRDVIHSFWAPNIQGKRDLIPGYSNAIWFQVDKEGTYRGQCAEFCGFQHAHMTTGSAACAPRA